MTVDLVALGEVMLRMDPGLRRIRAARSFDAHAGGGEYNVAAGLASMGLTTRVITALPDTETGALAGSLIRAAGVGTELINFSVLRRRNERFGNNSAASRAK